MGDLPAEERVLGQGVSSSAILSFIDAVDHLESMNSFMLLCHGHVVAEGWWAPYEADSPHALYSLSKSFTSTAVGLAVADGKLSLDDPVLKFCPPPSRPRASSSWRTMRGVAEEAVFRMGARPVASLAAYPAAPADYTAYRLPCAVRRKGALDQLPAALGVFPAHHPAGRAEVTERRRDLPEALLNSVRLAETCRDDVQGASSPSVG